MALSLTEAAKLSNDVVLAGVIETIVKESPVLERVPFIEMVGNALTYFRPLAGLECPQETDADLWRGTGVDLLQPGLRRLGQSSRRCGRAGASGRRGIIRGTGTGTARCARSACAGRKPADAGRRYGRAGR